MSDEWTIRTNALPLGDEGSDYHVGYHYHRPGLINDDVIDEGLKPDSKRPPGFFHPSKWFYRWTILALSSCFLFAAYFADVMIGSTAPLLISEAGFSSFQVGMLMSATAFPSVVISPISGVLIDKIGTNKTSLFFNFINFIGTLLFAYFDSFYGKLVGALVLGVGFEPMGIVQDGIIARWFMWSEGEPVSPSVPLAYGMSFSGTLLGQFLGMVITPVVAETSLKIALYIPAGIMLANFICNIFFVILDYRAAPILGLDEVDEEAEEFSIKHILHFPIVFWLLSFISLFSYSQIWMLMTFSTDYVHNEFEGYSTSDAAHVNSIMYGIPLVLSPIVGYFLQKTKLFVTTMTIGAVLLAVGELMLTFTWIHPIATMTVLGIAYCLVPAAIWPMINVTVREDMIATAFGLTTLIMAVGGVLGPIGLGYLADELGSYRYPFYVLTGLAGIGVVLCLVICVMGWVKKEKFAWSLDQSYQVVGRDEEEDDDETQEDWVEQARITGEDAWVDYADYDDDDDDVDDDDDEKEVNERQDSYNYSNNISINGREHTANEQHAIERRPLHGSGGGARAEQGTATENGGGAKYGTNGGTVGDARSH